MGKASDLLKSAVGGRMGTLGRWRQEVSRALGASGGIVALENNQLAVPLTMVEQGPEHIILTSSTFTVDGATQAKQAMVRVGVNARLQAGDTLVTLSIQLQVSASGGPFAALRSYDMGEFTDDAVYRSSTFEMIQPIAVDATVAYRIVGFVAGTATDAIVIDIPDGYAWMTVQINNVPE